MIFPPPSEVPETLRYLAHLALPVGMTNLEPRVQV